MSLKQTSHDDSSPQTIDPVQILMEDSSHPTYSQSAKCITQSAEVLVIDRADFARQLWNCPIEVWEEINQIIKSKIKKTD